MPDEPTNRSLHRWDKIQALRVSPPPVRLGTRYALGAHGLIWLTAASLMLFITGLFLYTKLPALESDLVLAIIPFSVAVACFVASGVRIRRPKTPRRAVRNFFQLIARSAYRAAWDMLVPTEQTPSTGAFDSFESFRQYWGRVRKTHRLRGGKVTLTDFAQVTGPLGCVVCRVTIESAPDVAVVPGVLAVELGEFHQVSFNKILVPSGGEWFMWSGQLQADDEADISWIAEETGDDG